MWKKFCLGPPQRGGRQLEPGRAAGCCNLGCLTIWQCLLLDAIQSPVRHPVRGTTFTWIIWPMSQTLRGSWLAVDGVTEVTGFYSSSVTALSPPLRSLNHFDFPLSHIFLHLVSPPRIHPFRNWVLALSCLSSLLLSPLLHLLLTMSIMPACLMWWRRMVSITCNKRDGA